VKQPELFLFGAPRLERDGSNVAIERRKAFALLAYLASMPGPHARSSLGVLLWPDADATQGRANLSRALVDVREAIGADALSADVDRVGLHPDALTVDAARFRACVTQVEAHRHGRDPLCDDCLSLLAEAADLYCGDFLAGFTLRDTPEFDTWQTFQSESLRLELGETLEKLALGYADRNDTDRAIPYARRWLNLDPLSEPAHRCLMQLYAASGERAAAFAQYETCQKALQSALGIPPEPETTALYEQIKKGVVPARRMEAAAGVSAALRPAALRPVNNVPAQSGAFIGRERELAEVAARLADPACRLLTVLGPGGIGKTRLAIEAGRAELPRFPHGVCFVDLAPVASVGSLSAAILGALGAPERPGASPDQQLLDLLKDRQLLLVLDNYEHLLSGAEPDRRDACGLVTQMVANASHVKLVVTSRERLKLHDEWLLPIKGLELRPIGARHSPGEALASLKQYPATALFLNCLLRVCPGLKVVAEDVSTIAHICRMLDGSPLAIELAAAWTRVLPLAEIAQQLERGLELLTTTMRGVPARQRSMTATFDYSWRMLSGRQRSLLCQLSVFSGGFTREAAEAVSDATLAELASLGDASWLGPSVAGRYALHELVRQYCAGKLASEYAAEAGETADQVRKRHAAYYEDLVHSLGKAWFQGRKPDVAIGPDFGNMVAAWNRMLAQDELAIAWGLCHGLGFLSDRLGRSPEVALLFDESRPLLRAAQAAERDTSRYGRRSVVLALMLVSQSERLHYMARYDDAAACMQEAEAWLDLDAERDELWDEHWAEAHWFYRRALVYRAYDSGDAPAQITLGRESLAQLRSGCFCPWSGAISHWLPEAHMLIGWGEALLGDYGEARRMGEQASAIAEATGSDFTLGFQQYLLAWALLCLGEYAGAAEAAQRMLPATALEDVLMKVLALTTQGRVQLALGRYGQARSFWRRSLALAREVGMGYEIAASLVGLGDLELACGRPLAGLRWYEESAAPAGTPAAVSALIGRGRVALLQGHPAQAREHFRQALRACRYGAATQAEAIVYTAESLLQEDELTRAAELFSFAIEWRGAPAPVKQVAEKLLRTIKARLPEGDLAAAMIRGGARELNDVVAELVEEHAAQRIKNG
jgi:predicted ATPase/DNA-binding SARP family transcriptional activator